VPVGLGVAVGRAILNHMSGEKKQAPLGFKFSRYNGTDETSWERQALSAKSSVIMKKTKRSTKSIESNQNDFFENG
jgi:hypothetical protein